MRLVTCIAAAGLLSTAAEAAPRAIGLGKLRSLRHAFAEKMAREEAEQVQPRNHKSGNADMMQGDSSNDMEMKMPAMDDSSQNNPGKLTTLVIECPANSVVVSTTTVDVTVYVTATAHSTSEPCDDDMTSSTHSTMTEPCDDDTMTAAMTSTPCPDDMVTTATSMEEPCDTDTAMPMSTGGGSASMTKGPYGNSTMGSTEPCDSETKMPMSTGGAASSSMVKGPHANTTLASTEPCDTDTMMPMSTGGAASSSMVRGPHANTTMSSTEPCDTETMTSSMAATSTEPCDTDTMSATESMGATTTEPCDTETMAPTSTGPCDTDSMTATSTEPCDTETMAPTSTEPCDTDSMTATSTEPCDTETMAPTSTEPCDTDSMTATSTEPCDTDTMTSSTPTAPIVTPFTTFSSTQTTAAPTTDCVIDMSMTPATMSKMTSTPVMPAHPTKTVCEHDNQTGTPERDAMYCGVKGEPVGTYFIAEFIEERPGVPVTEEGCYQFCDSVMESTDGCKSYRFYNNDLGAPRCELYGMPVSYVVRDIDVHQPGRFFDLTCGSPKDESWHSKMPTDHQTMSA